MSGRAVIIGVFSATLCAVSGADAQERAPVDGPSQSRAYLAKLVEALENDDSFKVRLQAAVLLGRSGEAAAVDPLIRALNEDEHYTVRAAAATALANLEESRAISHILKRIALDRDDFVREEASRALDKYDREVALPYVIATYDGFESPDASKVRRVAVDYVLRDEVGPEADGILERALGDETDIARIAADYLLAMERSEEALAVLNEAIRNKEPTVRRGAVLVLEAMNSKPATDLILEVYERDIEVEEVKEATRNALRARRSFLDIDQVIREASRGTEKHARGRALKLLGVVGGIEAEKVLVSALEDSDIYIRGNAVLAMQWLGSPTVAPSLEKLAEDPSNQRIMHLVQNTLKKLRKPAATN